MKNAVSIMISSALILAACGKNDGKKKPSGADPQKIAELEGALATTQGQVNRLKAENDNLKKAPPTSATDAQRIKALEAQILKLEADLKKRPATATPSTASADAEELKKVKAELEKLKASCTAATDCKAQTDPLNQKIAELEEKVRQLQPAPPPPPPPAPKVTGKLPPGYAIKKKRETGWDGNELRVVFVANLQTTDAQQTLVFPKITGQNRFSFIQADGTPLASVPAQVLLGQYTTPELQFDNAGDPKVKFTAGVAPDADVWILEQTPAVFSQVQHFFAHIAGDNETQATFAFPYHNFIVTDAAAPMPADADATAFSKINKLPAAAATSSYALWTKSPDVKDVVPPSAMKCALTDGTNSTDLTVGTDGTWLKYTHAVPLTYVPTFVSCSSTGLLRRTGTTEDPATLAFQITINVGLRK